MKHLIKVIAETLFLGSLFSSFSATYAKYYPIEDIYKVSGGKTVITFDNEDDLDNFFLFSEFDKSPEIIDEKLYFYNLAEQKAIYANGTYEAVDVSVDINTINKNGKFDTGIYFATDFNYRLDGAVGFEVNLEKGAGSAAFYLKLHEFNHGYRGAKVEVSGLKLPTVDLNLRVVVRERYLYAFVNHEVKPRFKYYVGAQARNVGLRNFYSPNYVDNFTVIGESEEISKSKLETLIEKAEKIDQSLYTSGTISNLNDILVNAKLAASYSDQYDIDKYEDLLEKALNELIIKRTAAELEEALTKAKNINNEDEKYTTNSYKALLMVIEIAEEIDRNDEEKVSYWCNQLEKKIDALIAYL